MRYAIGLTTEEIKTLIMILNRVGGSPTLSPRKFADSVYNKLVGIEGIENFSYNPDEAFKGSENARIFFADFTEETITIRKPF